MRTFIADFETTTDPNDCRVWAYAICEVGNQENLIIGNNIDDFMEFCANRKENYKILFHNLKFDSQFIMTWLFQNEFKHTREQSERKTRTFNTIINDKGLYYQIEVIFQRTGKNINKVTFQDSEKLLDMGVEDIAKTFKLPFSKLKIDYHEYRKPGHELTKEEIEYIKNDVKIVATAIEFFYANGLDKMTIGACALSDYKKTIKEVNFKRFFPSTTIQEFDREIRQSYKGGFTYLNPKFKDKIIKDGIVLDFNSVYPSIMYDELLPYGTPIFYTGKYEHDEFYPLYIQMIKCQFELKKGKIPTIQIRHGADFSGSEYLTSSNYEERTLCLTSVDLELFLQQYDVYNIQYLSGWKYKAANGLFHDYVEKWYKVKVKAKEEKNWGMYQIAKRMLNALYGKFGTLPKFVSKNPELNKENVIVYGEDDIIYRDGMYLAMASFITSHARARIINAAQKVTDDYNEGKSNIEFIYADTDSLHLKSKNFEKPAYFEYDDLELGKFKVEKEFKRAKYLRQKCYIMDCKEPGEKDFQKKITVAGMPKGCYQYVTFKNFKIGARYQGSLKAHSVSGGVVLSEVDFTIKKV